MGEYENSAVKAASKLQAARDKSGEDNKKVVITFVIVMAVSLLIGFLSGYFFTTEGDGEALNKILSEISVFLKFNIGYISLVTNIVACGICFLLYTQAKTLYKSWDGEDEDVLDQTEGKIFYTMSIPSIMFVLNFLFYGITICSKPIGDEYNSKVAFAVALTSAIFMLSMIWEVLLQGLSVSLLKKINPEKRGNILDFRFDKKWLDSCDEAQKMAVYKTSYVTNKVTKYVFVTGWIVALLTNEILHFGMFPIVLISVMWLVQTIAYVSAAHKYERGHTIL